MGRAERIAGCPSRPISNSSPAAAWRARASPEWTCLFANDFDARKGASYAANWGADHLRVGDIHDLSAADLPGHADLAWASFPCQDLSLAGAGAGLGGARSGAFFGFARLIEALAQERRAPKLLAVENVVGLLTASGGADFVALCQALQKLGYRFGALTMDAAHFTPQSRPRLFVVAVRSDAPMPPDLIAAPASADWATSALVRARGRPAACARPRLDLVASAAAAGAQRHARRAHRGETARCPMAIAG